MEREWQQHSGTILWKVVKKLTYILETIILQSDVESFAGRTPIPRKVFADGDWKWLEQAGACSTPAAILRSVSSGREHFWKLCLCPREGSYLWGAYSQCSSNSVHEQSSSEVTVTSGFSSLRLEVWLVITLIMLEIVDLQDEYFTGSN